MLQRALKELRSTLQSCNVTLPSYKDLRTFCKHLDVGNIFPLQIDIFNILRGYTSNLGLLVVFTGPADSAIYELNGTWRERVFEPGTPWFLMVTTQTTRPSLHCIPESECQCMGYGCTVKDTLERVFGCNEYQHKLSFIDADRNKKLGDFLISKLQFFIRISKAKKIPKIK